MKIICTDLEGIYLPEIWIKFAEKTGIDELRLTTRDIPDYDVLMQKRLNILKENNLKLKDITDVIKTIEPLNGAIEFLDWLRSVVQVIVVSDTFIEFATPLMKKLGRPALFCHNLIVDQKGAITGYNLRQKDGKRKTVQALKGLNFDVIAIGDSYNDVSMLKEAEQGILFNPPDKVKNEFPNFPVTCGYDKLKPLLTELIKT